MRKFYRQLLIGFIAMAIVLIVMVLLPHNTYVRWQATKIEAFARLGWIYERIHYDDTPIDIAFVGTSHTLMGIDPQAFEKAIDVSDARDADGQCLHVVNFAIPSYGRDLHWAIVRELLENRKVNTLVLEVFENETRKSHPLFYTVADMRDILHAPMFINIGYMHDLIRLPYRQLSLWMKSMAPQSFGFKDHFDAGNYDGSNVDNTQVVNVDGRALSPVRNDVIDPKHLEQDTNAQLKNKDLSMLGAWAHDYEYAVPDYYVKSILDLAREKNTDVVFLYLPQHGMPPQPYDMSLYQGHGDWIYANDVLQHPEYWSDVAHLNAPGAEAFTKRVIAEFLKRWETNPAARKADGVEFSADKKSCSDNSYPVRDTLKPFVSHKEINFDKP